MRSYKTLIYMVTLMAIFSLLGCSKDNQATGPETAKPPDLPSVNTMTMDVDFFNTAQVDAQSMKIGKLDESDASLNALKLNFLNAAVRVFFLNLVAHAALTEPVAAFVTAIHSVPQYQQDGSWLWTYVYVDDHNSEYSIFLRGKRLDTCVAWSMEVSSNDPDMLLDHFLWFDGEVETGGHSGYWQFYEPESSAVTDVMVFAGNETGTPGVKCIRIDWQNESAIERRLAFLTNKPGDPSEGSELVFEEALEMASIDFYDAANGNSGTIVWYRDGSGSIEWPDYKDGIKSCWDVWQYDADCE
jgi:hypothetical protein